MRIAVSFVSLMLFINGLSAHGHEPQKEIYDTQALTLPRLSPEETAASAKMPDGFKMQVAAKDPDVQQPIGMCWDSRGRLWIAENYTYGEREVNFDEALNDRILILEDTNHDGHFEKRTVFWDRAKKLTSIEIGYGGVWVMAPPQLLFIPDADRDDKPDGPPQVVLDGFEDKTIRHNLANGLRWGPDGWLYGRHGIQAVSHVGIPGSAEIERTYVTCGIWRWHPTRKKLDVVCTGTTNPWGHDWDENGQLFFINTVIGHLWHAIPGAHLQRMYGEDRDPIVYELMTQVADHLHFDGGHEQWATVREKGISPATDRAGGGHAHCGMMFYQGNNWPAEYRNKLFTLNYHGRRINVERMTRVGAGYVASTNPTWFTFPTNGSAVLNSPPARTAASTFSIGPTSANVTTTTAYIDTAELFIESVTATASQLSRLTTCDRFPMTNYSHKSFRRTLGLPAKLDSFSRSDAMTTKSRPIRFAI